MTTAGAGGSPLITLNVRGTKLTVPKRTLAEIPMYEPLLNERWSDESYVRDNDDLLFIYDDPVLFEQLLHYLENLRRPSPLALELPPPSFEGIKEQEFRLMVDGYGLTDSLYPLVLLRDTKLDNADGSGTFMHVNSSITKPLLLPFSFDEQDEQHEHTIAAGNNHSRKIRAFEVTVENPRLLGRLRIGWASEQKRTFYLWDIQELQHNDAYVEIRYREEDLDAYSHIDIDREEFHRTSLSLEGPAVIRFERDRMKILENGQARYYFPNTPAPDLQPRILVTSTVVANNSMTISKIELDS